MDPINITRRHAIRGQLDTAINLYFGGGDLVSAHVLASAASEVSRGLSKHRGLEPLEAKFEQMIRPEKIKFWRDAVNRHYNFFKHADKDADVEEITFHPETTRFELFAGVENYSALFNQLSMPMAIFRGFMVKSYPDLFSAEYLKQVAPGMKLFEEQAGSPTAAATSFLDLYNRHGLKSMQKHPNIEI